MISSRTGWAPAALRVDDLQQHAYATWLLSDGVPINDVAKVMGRGQTSTTLNRYTHSTAERDRRVLAAFAALSLPSIRRQPVVDRLGPCLLASWTNRTRNDTNKPTRS
jgi:hypothetical protein